MKIQGLSPQRNMSSYPRDKRYIVVCAPPTKIRNAMLSRLFFFNRYLPQLNVLFRPIY